MKLFTEVLGFLGTVTVALHRLMAGGAAGEVPVAARTKGRLVNAAR